MCWLCTYQGETLGKKLNEFIVKHIGVMDMQSISKQEQLLMAMLSPQLD
jgi:hypothetical protein